MSQPVVVWVQDAFGNQLPRISLLEPLRHPQAQTGLDLNFIQAAGLFNLMQTGPWQPDVIEQVGTKLYGWLTNHPAINAEFIQALAVTDPAFVPIYLRVDHPQASELPWEALNEPNTGFLATNRRWPIARVKDVPRAKTEYLYQPPLHIMAVMGASGTDATTRISAKPEWEELHKAIDKSNLNVKLRVLVCEDDLKNEIDALGISWIECEFLSDQRTLFSEIEKFKPQFLHFFCHGIAAVPPFLQVGTRLDWRMKQTGSINIEASELRQRADKEQNVWLLTLNCCESAQLAPGSSSRSLPLASSLVSVGFPAVVGMRERVESHNANLFCGEFYKNVLDELKGALNVAQQKGSSAEICWASALYAARQELCRQADAQRPVAQVARESKDWTIPVIYLRSAPFQIRLMPDPQGARPIERTGVLPPLHAQPAPLTLAQKLDLAAEMQQLIDQRKQFEQQPKLASVVQSIDNRIAEIQKQLAEG